MTQFIGSIDQGTTSSRFIIFDRQGDIVASDQREHEQIYPKAGWVEHNPTEIWRNTQHVIAAALKKANLKAADIASVGITNQRETTLLWDLKTGVPLHNAVVWMDTRTDELVARYTKDGGADRLREKPACPSRPISPASSCAGYSIKFPVPVKRPKLATRFSAPSTHGWSGTSPAAPMAAFTSPM